MRNKSVSFSVNFHLIEIEITNDIWFDLFNPIEMENNNKKKTIYRRTLINRIFNIFIFLYLFSKQNMRRFS